MYPDNFDYYRPESVDEALDMLAENSGAELLAGGHSLLPTMKSGLSSPDSLVDISDVGELTGIEYGEETIMIGAATTYADIVDDDDLWEESTVFAETTYAVGDKQVRNRGTIGGNIAHSDPASDIPAAALAADVTVHVQGPDGERAIPIDDFFHGMYANDIAEDEILTAVEVPRQPDAAGTYKKKPSPSSGYALVAVAVNLQAEDGTLTDVRVAANGVMDHGVRLGPVEDALTGEAVDSLSATDIEEAASHAPDDLDEFMVMDDMQASPDFRLQLLKVYTEDAVDTALASLET
jgi:carbon-monoxide dehydrogenase medium subunit